MTQKSSNFTSLVVVVDCQPLADAPRSLAPRTRTTLKILETLVVTWTQPVSDPYGPLMGLAAPLTLHLTVVGGAAWTGVGGRTYRGHPIPLAVFTPLR